MEDGIKNEAFLPNEIVLADDTWTRISAPATSSTPVSIIFWSKHDANDNQPTPDKIVSTLNFYYLIYLIYIYI